MNKLEALLASVDVEWTRGNIHEIEDHMEHVRGVSEVSINPVSGNALIVIDRSKTNFAKVRDAAEKEGVHISKVLIRKKMKGY